jgi:hypothetical protein
MRKHLTVDFEGTLLTTPAADDATHVVVSHPPTGGLRVQPTSNPLGALVQAQRGGDATPRMAAVDADHATFTVVPGYDPTDSSLADAERRSRRWEVWALAVVVAAAALLVLVL